MSLGAEGPSARATRRGETRSPRRAAARDAKRELTADAMDLPSDDPGLVTVIVPAFNAQKTLDATLSSVRAQSHANLEILVVDDGSTDRTAQVAAEHAKADPRVRLISQQNSGVAAARNRGLSEARGDWVAPVDADDLWRPEKIARQLAAARGDVALVYTWSAIIDGRGDVISRRSRPQDEGDVFERMCRGNMLGNGSSALMRRDAVLAAGGYDVSLRARDAQGCEDLGLYLKLAETYAFACVPAFLTGYRVDENSMSGDLLRMWRSYGLATQDARDRRPDRDDDFFVGDIEVARWLLIRALRRGQLAIAREVLSQLFVLDRGAAFRSILRMPLHFSRLGFEAIGRLLVKPRPFLSA